MNRKHVGVQIIAEQARWQPPLLGDHPVRDEMGPSVDFSLKEQARNKRRAVESQETVGDRFAVPGASPGLAQDGIRL